MRVVSSPSHTVDLKKLYAHTDESHVLVQTLDGTEYVVTLVDDFDFELAQQRQSRELMAYLDELAREAKGKPGIPLNEVMRKAGLLKSRNPIRKPKMHAAHKNGR